MSCGTAVISCAKPSWSIIMGTTIGCASARIAENTNAVLTADAELLGRESSLTAKS